MILIIDTSSSGIKLALGQSPSLAKGCPSGGVVAKNIDTLKQSLDLPVKVKEFLDENNIKWVDLSAIGVVVGPGSFTGIRLGIAYAKGLSIGLKIPVIPVNAFEIYLYKNVDAFVAINSGRSDLFVGANDMEPGTMEIEQIETFQMKYPKTVGHKPYDLLDALSIVQNKLKLGITEPVVPMYLRPSYAELNAK